MGVNIITAEWRLLVRRGERTVVRTTWLTIMLDKHLRVAILEHWYRRKFERGCVREYFPDCGSEVTKCPAESSLDT